MAERTDYYKQLSGKSSEKVNSKIPLYVWLHDIRYIASLNPCNYSNHTLTGKGKL